MANSIDGQGHKNKYLDTSRKNAHVQYESSDSNDQCQFKKKVKCHGQKV